MTTGSHVRPRGGNAAPEQVVGVVGVGGVGTDIVARLHAKAPNGEIEFLLLDNRHASPPRTGCRQFNLPDRLRSGIEQTEHQWLNQTIAKVIHGLDILMAVGNPNGATSATVVPYLANRARVAGCRVGVVWVSRLVRVAEPSAVPVELPTDPDPLVIRDLVAITARRDLAVASASLNAHVTTCVSGDALLESLSEDLNCLDGLVLRLSDAAISAQLTWLDGLWGGE